MNFIPFHVGRAANPRLVVELAGLAGAGKSTIARTLQRQGETFQLKDYPYYRRLEHLRFFIHNGLALLPTWVQLKQERGRWFTRRELAWMMIGVGWYRFFERRSLRDGPIFLLDQGAIFLLAQLYAFGPECLHCIGAEKWWQKVFDRWARVLDLVVWLDAPERILLERIRTRNELHVAKDWPDTEALDFLRRYRTAYEQVLTELTVNRTGPRILWLDTAQVGVDETVARILQFLASIRSVDVQTGHKL